MAYQIEIENELQSYEVVRAIADRMEKNEEVEDEKAVSALGDVLEQLEGQPAHDVVVED